MKRRTRFKWGRLLTNPTTHVESVEGDVTRVRVDGLVCSSVCAVRTEDALRALRGVERVDVDFDTGIATIVGAPQDAQAYEQAVTRVVAGTRLRRMIEHVARAFGHRPAGPGHPPSSV
jgi:copper chaperone CopZ